VQYLVFSILADRFRLGGDVALAARVHKQGIASLRPDFPQLTRAIDARVNLSREAVDKQLSRRIFADIHASSPRARSLRDLMVELPLTSIIGAKLRVGTSRLMVRLKSGLDPLQLPVGRALSFEWWRRCMLKWPGHLGRRQLRKPPPRRRM
jgi:hypothetical protein